MRCAFSNFSSVSGGVFAAFLMRNRKLFGGSDAAVPSFLEMSYSETRTKNIVGFEEN